MRVISLGWGCQSFALAAMSALGVLPKVDYVIHADTTHEQQSTYEFAKRWTPWLEEHGMKVITVTPNRGTSPLANEWGGVFIPAYTIGDGVYGQLRRQCTYEWKVKPIKRWLQKHRNKEPVEMWLGITLDESHRAKQADVKYIHHRWPFLERQFWNGRMLRRGDVIRWLVENLGKDAVPGKSACYFCPYHTKAEWRRIYNSPDWKKAVEFDRAIRKLRPPYDLFVHRDRVPLEEVDMSSPEDHGQLPLWTSR